MLLTEGWLFAFLKLYYFKLNERYSKFFFYLHNFLGRSQTTKGIWIDKCVDIEPFTIVMDLEGTDGTERGEVMYFNVLEFNL